MRDAIAAGIEVAEGVLGTGPLERDFRAPVHQREIEELSEIH